MKKILISGVKPTGRPHIGNYFGAMKQFVDMQDDYESSIFVADLHALTGIDSAQELKSNILEEAIDYLAIGLDPKKVTLFKQSDVPQVAELAWIFDCMTTMPYLMRAHAFKDAEAKNKDINVGVFNYPILMAADILLSDADVVPVGSDQKQHIEITRDIAEKFNRLFGKTFKLPKEIILEEFATVIGTDGQKMSKSYGNTIPLFATTEEIQKAVMKIPTDSKGASDPKDTDSILFKIHKLFLDQKEQVELKKEYERGISYKEAKEKLIESAEKFIAPLRERRAYWANKKEEVLKILKDGGEKANERAEKIMTMVRKNVGLTL
ncbi:MAG TPA: tryptophan--tRNA ligase [Candidatus Paceibacterota bacterium]|nr:tryptophan--tRNA ligase [Candidatus Paceibacterota bacterium]HRZ34552.1 tryptophan--tRNA ligase [Candidatus Paceibacterota bacterium]